MSQELIDLSPDLKQLVDEGYSIEIRSTYLLVHDIPYVNSQKKVLIGSLACPLTLSGNKTSQPADHVVFFIGEYPCNADGSMMTCIQHQSLLNKDLGSGIIVNYSFSNKPKKDIFKNYYDKLLNYIRIIVPPATRIEPSIKANLFKQPITDGDDENVFCYRDSNTSRANIGSVISKLKNKKIGIIGLGGTGSYVLDMVAKTPVAEIHLFDKDKFYTHNAFRTPGAASKIILEENKYKTDYLKSIYSNMHKGIFTHNIFLGSDGLDCLLSMDFVFICIDSGSDKKIIIDALVDKSIPFIDTGIGIELQDNCLSGIVRNTVVSKLTNDSWKKRISYVDSRDDVYASNIQIAEINNLCAALAVIKWKKYYGIYSNSNNNDFISYDICMGEIINEN